jgi:hypothetical protein
MYEMMETLTEDLFGFFQIVQYFIAEIIFPKMLPNSFNRIEFWTVRRKGQQANVFRDSQFVSAMPSGAIQKHKAILSLKELGGMVKEKRHNFSIHGGHDERGQLAIFWTNSRQRIDKLPDHLVSYHWPFREWRPTTALVADSSKPAFILEQDSDLHSLGRFS